MLPILTLQRHEKAVHTLAVLHDSVFSGSEDMEIKVQCVCVCVCVRVQECVRVCVHVRV